MNLNFIYSWRYNNGVLIVEIKKNNIEKLINTRSKAKISFLNMFNVIIAGWLDLTFTEHINSNELE